MANKLKVVGRVPPAVVEKREIIRSFADIPRDAVATVEVVPDPKMYVPWTPEAKMLTVLGKATETLQTWLTARFADLVRERVALERIDVVHAGGRTIVKVDGKQRFEFKLKCQMEGEVMPLMAVYVSSVEDGLTFMSQNPPLPDYALVQFVKTQSGASIGFWMVLKVSKRQASHLRAACCSARPSRPLICPSME